MRRLLGLFILVIVCLPAWPMPARALSVGGLVEAANAQRAAAGLPQLSLNGALSVAAADKAADMIKGNYWAHVSPSGVGPWYWISAAGYPYLYAGENLAQGYADDSSVMAAWMNSPEHRANVLGVNYHDMGCGFASGMLQGVQTTVAACDFASTAAELAPPPAARPVISTSASPTAQSQVSAPIEAAAPPPVPAKSAAPSEVPDYFKHSVLFQEPVRSLGVLLQGLLP